MSGISGISASSYDYSSIASGKQINSAADDAAGLTIVEEEDAQVTGYNKGSENAKSAQDLLNTADNAMAGIHDYLQQIKELAVKALNTATLSDDDLQAIQDQIEQYKQGISDLASNTQFNTKNILDGSNSEMSVATDANGSVETISNANSTLEELGIADLDVTGDFDISTIDDAIEKVSSMRSENGAQSNALDYTINYNSSAAYNLTSSKSSLEDLDIPQAVSEKKKQETLQAYALMMQRERQKQEENETNILLG